MRLSQLVLSVAKPRAFGASTIVPVSLMLDDDSSHHEVLLVGGTMSPSDILSAKLDAISDSPEERAENLTEIEAAARYALTMSW